MTSEKRRFKKQNQFKQKFENKCKKQLSKEINSNEAGTAFLLIYKKDISKYSGYSEDVVLNLAKSFGYNLNSRVENSYCFLYEFTTRPVKKVKYINELSES